MLAAIVVSVMFQTGPIPLAEFRVDGFSMRGYVGGVAARDALVVGFFCDFTGHHGETDLAKPFVITKGKREWLPLKGNNYGHAVYTDGTRVFGSVSVDYDDVATIWSQDSRGNWTATILNVKGRVVFVEKSGAMLIENLDWRNDETKAPYLVRYDKGKVTNVVTEKFMFVGEDAQGRIIGNRFENWGFGMSPNDPQAWSLSKGNWTKLPEGFYASAVNRSGKLAGAGGEHHTVPHIYRDRLQALPLPKGATYGRATCISDAGTVGGYFYRDEHDFACVWTGTKLTSLAGYFKATEDSEVATIDSTGTATIAAKSEKGVRLFSLKLKP